MKKKIEWFQQESDDSLRAELRQKERRQQRKKKSKRTLEDDYYASDGFKSGSGFSRRKRT